MRNFGSVILGVPYTYAGELEQKRLRVAERNVCLQFEAGHGEDCQWLAVG